MAAKTTNKTAKADKENEVKVENIVVDTPTVDENINVVESTEVSLDPEQIKENLESVDTEIKDDDSSLEGIQKNMEEALKPLNDIVDSVSEIGTDYETINKEINKNPNDDAKAQELIENEIKKVESLKNNTLTIKSFREFLKDFSIDLWTLITNKFHESVL